MDALRADIDLIWENAITFNGEGSWITRPVGPMKTFTARKFAEATAGPAAAHAHPVAAARGAGVGNVPYAEGSPLFITPAMRNQLFENSQKLKDVERVEIGKLVTAMCPRAADNSVPTEMKIDVDAMDPKTFVRIDTYVRRLLAAALNAAQATGIVSTS